MASKVGLYLMLVLVLSSAIPADASILSKLGKILIEMTLGGMSKFSGGKLAGPAKLLPIIGPTIHKGLSTSSQIARVLGSTHRSKRQVKSISEVVRKLQSHGVQLMSSLLSRNKEQIRQNRHLVQQGLQKLVDKREKLGKVGLNMNEILLQTQRTNAFSNRIFTRLGQVGEVTSKMDRNVGNLQQSMEEQKTLQLQTLSQMEGVAQSVDNYGSSIVQQIASVDEDLAMLKKATDGIDGKVGEANHLLDKLQLMSRNISNDLNSLEGNVLNEIISSTNVLHQLISSVESEMEVGFTMMQTQLNGFSSDLTGGFETITEKIADLKQSIMGGLDKVLQHLLEQDTSNARECYRALMEELTQHTGDFSSGIKLLVNPPWESSRDRRIVKRMLDKFSDSGKGAEACLQEFRAIYDTATSFLGARNLFKRLRDKFQLYYQNGTSWEQLTANAVLKNLHHVMHQLTLQVTNLFMLESATIAAKQTVANLEQVEGIVGASTKQLDETVLLDGAMQRLSVAATKIVENFDTNFPACPLNNVLNEAHHTFRLYCDSERVSIPSMLPESCNDAPAFSPECQQEEGFPVGTTCRFECLQQANATVPPLVCGPGGQWSRSEEKIKAAFLSCIRAMNSQAGVLSHSTSCSPEEVHKLMVEPLLTEIRLLKAAIGSGSAPKETLGTPP